MWFLIAVLLVGDAIVGYCWWRECQAHARSRRALVFWRDYRRGEGHQAQPTTVPLHAMDSDHGMAAVTEVLRAKVAAHKAGRTGRVIGLAVLLLALTTSWAVAQQATPPPPTPPAASKAEPAPAPAPAVAPNAPMPIPDAVAREVDALRGEMRAHQISMGTLQDRIAALSSRINQALASALPAGRVLGAVCRDGKPECADDQKVLMMVVPPPAKDDGGKK